MWRSGVDLDHGSRFNVLFRWSTPWRSWHSRLKGFRFFPPFFHPASIQCGCDWEAAFWIRTV